MEDIVKLSKAYKRFVQNKDKNEAINIYPEYEKDLDIILNFVHNELTMLNKLFEEGG